jgi:hypothetical protein
MSAASQALLDAEDKKTARMIAQVNWRMRILKHLHEQKGSSDKVK